MRSWAVWQLPLVVRAYVLGVIAVTAACAGSGVGVGAAAGGIRGGDVGLFALLLGCAAASELVRRLGDPVGVLAKDLLTVWWLPLMVLLPPVYALLAPVPVIALAAWGVPGVLLYRRVFSAAAIGLAHAGASALFHVLPWRSSPFAPDVAVSQGPAARAVPWALAVAGCAVLALVANAVLVGVAVKAADPQTSWRELLWDSDKVGADLVAVCAGVLVALAAAAARPLVLFAVPPVLLLERGVMWAQLRAAARLDAKTGLLNAVTWEREAAGALITARRHGSPAAVLLLDIDHFKRVNDTYGHLAGDQVLRAVAGVLRSQLRDEDLVGRFGGEEFSVLLPGLGAASAHRTAERLRQRIGALVVPVDEGVLVQVTMSVGVAVTDPPDLTVADLLAAADAGLYQAKAEGRDQVRLRSYPDRRSSS